MNLLQQLVKSGLLEKEKAASLEREIKDSGKREEEVLLEQKIVSEDYLFELKKENLKIPLKKFDIEEVPLKTLETIPEESAKFYQMIPLMKKDNELEVGMVYPEDLKAQQALEFLARQTKFSYKIFLITLSDFKALLKRYRTLKGEISHALGELESELKTEKVREKPEVDVGMEFGRIVEEAPISKIVVVILRHAVDGNATDIHIEPLKDKIRVRFRLDGILHSSIFLPIKILPAIISKIKILANLKIDETRIPQDGRFSFEIGEKNIDFRVSTFPTILGEKIAIRVLDPEQAIVEVKKLGISGRNFEVIKKAIEKPYGLILVTGPTGSGKTTTLYAILKILNKDDVNIMTLEDPVEYFIEGVNQSQIKPEIGYEFATGLRHMLRQDPNVIMVGEIRDKETASLAIHAGLTGHLILSTLHTNDALGVIPRLIDMGIEPFLISPTLNIAIAQRLIRKLCPDCRKMKKPSEEIKDLFLREIGKMSESLIKEINFSDKNSYIYEAVGCKKCKGIGYIGRVGIYEVLESTPQLCDIILKEPSETKIREEAKRQGMITMLQDGIIKVINGDTTIEEVMRATVEEI